MTDELKETQQALADIMQRHLGMPMPPLQEELLRLLLIWRNAQFAACQIIAWNVVDEAKSDPSRYPTGEAGAMEVWHRFIEEG